MKVMFLDFDGVLLPLPASGQFDPNLEPSMEAINNLNIVSQLTGARVVVSSAWRKDRSVGELSKLLKGWGFKGQVIDKTPHDAGDSDRGRDIARWLDDARNNEGPVISSFVVIDDDPTDLEELSRRRVMPSPHVGMQFHDAQDAVRILGVPL